MFWHTISRVDVIKVGVLDIKSQIFTPQGEDMSYEFSLEVCLCAWGGIYGKNVSYPLLPILSWVFSHLSVV